MVAPPFAMKHHVSDSSLPSALLAVLPADPFDQLDIARKITSMAVTTRVSELEAEAGKLRLKLADKDMAMSTLQARVHKLEHELQQSSTQLSSVLDEQAKLAAEKTNLEVTVKKLTRDVAKLESFKKALMHSLQEDDDPQIGSEDKQSSNAVLAAAHSTASSIATSPDPPQQVSISNSPSPPPISTSGPSRLTSSYLSPPRGGSHSASSSPTKARSMVASPTKIRPTKGSSAATSPTKIRSKTASSSTSTVKNSANKWQSIGDGRFSLPSSLPTSKHTTAPNSPPHIARTARVDGKEFFRQARSRLSYEQFSAFLANIKELNAHHQTREETLKKANDIFGPENADLYDAFDGLLSRHLPGET